MLFTREHHAQGRRHFFRALEALIRIPGEGSREPLVEARWHQAHVRGPGNGASADLQYQRAKPLALERQARREALERDHAQ
ncbi:hypothetical protein D3C83_70290 [compost metagenome]